MDLEDVPEEKSSRSTRPTRSPLVTASRATPHPVAPPPTTRTSSGLAEVAPTRADSWTALGGTTPSGSWTFCRTAARAEPLPPPRSPEESDGGWRRSAPLHTVATAAAAPKRRRRVAVAMAGEIRKWKSQSERKTMKKTTTKKKKKKKKEVWKWREGLGDEIDFGYGNLERLGALGIGHEDLDALF